VLEEPDASVCVCAVAIRETGDAQIVDDVWPFLAKYTDGLILQAQTMGLANMYQQ
jgi:hypothetical protein